jgi:putative endonuclease
LSTLLSKAKKSLSTPRHAKDALGRKGERLAAKRLKSLGFRIIAKNYSNHFGEIDIIARQNDTLVFVEVKSRSGGPEGSAEYAVTREKQGKITRTALLYLKERSVTDVDYRFDVVTVHFSRHEKPRVALIENAFPV